MKRLKAGKDQTFVNNPQFCEEAKGRPSVAAQTDDYWSKKVKLAEVSGLLAQTCAPDPHFNRTNEDTDLHHRSVGRHLMSHLWYSARGILLCLLKSNCCTEMGSGVVTSHCEYELLRKINPR